MRIFVDCSYVDFSRQPTGIPRVVLKYIEAGYVWGEVHDVDVVPVVTTTSGLVPVRPIPGKAPPSRIVKYADRASDAALNLAAAAPHLEAAAAALRLALGKAGSHASAKTVDVETLSTFTKVLSMENLEIHVEPGDVVFYPAYWHDLDMTLLANLRLAGAKVFVLVHDILPVKFKRFYQSPWRERFAENLLRACEVADGMLAVSHCTASDVLAFAHQNDIALARVEVFHNSFDALIDEKAMRRSGSGQFLSPLSRKEVHEFLRDTQPYLMVGTIEPKKGHVPVIEAFEKMWQRGFERKLVLVGRRGWMDEDVVSTIRGSAYFNDRLFWFEDFDDVDLFFAYAYSRALVFASYAEGFGIPLIEASKALLPTICYDTPISREVAGGYVLYYSNLGEFEAHVAAMEDDKRHAAIKKSLAGFSWPTWQQTGQRLFEYLAASSHR